jgi:hypothetical protein
MGVSEIMTLPPSQRDSMLKTFIEVRGCTAGATIVCLYTWRADRADKVCRRAAGTAGAPRAVISASAHRARQTNAAYNTLMGLMGLRRIISMNTGARAADPRRRHSDTLRSRRVLSAGAAVRLGPAGTGEAEGQPPPAHYDAEGDRARHVSDARMGWLAVSDGERVQRCVPRLATVASVQRHCAAGG